MEIIRKNIVLLSVIISYLLSMFVLLQKDINEIMGVFYYLVATTLTDYDGFVFIGLTTYFWGIVFSLLYVIAKGIASMITKSHEGFTSLIYYWLGIYPLLFLLALFVFQNYYSNYFNWFFVIILSFPISYYARKTIGVFRSK